MARSIRKRRLVRVHVLEIELRQAHRPAWDDTLARFLASTTPGCVLTTVSAKGVEAIIVCDGSAGDEVHPPPLCRQVAARILAIPANRTRIDPARLYLYDALSSAEWDWLTSPAEVAARAAHHHLNPSLGTHLGGMIPVVGLRYPASPRPAKAVYVPAGGLLEARIIREVRRWTGSRPTRCATGAAVEPLAVGL